MTVSPAASTTPSSPATAALLAQIPQTRRRLLPAVLAVLAFLAAAGSASANADAFDRDFTGRTLRIDLYHAGTAAEEHLAVDRMAIEGPWPGSRTQLLDPTNLGKYRVEMVDLATQRPLYSRGFASIFGEWETTGEARGGTWRVIPEAVRVPEPRRPVQISVHKRANLGLTTDEGASGFRQIWTTAVDPASRFVDRPPLPEGDVTVLQEPAPVARAVDLVILGDGYTAAERDTFLDHARAFATALFAEEPFTSRRRDFNVRAVFTAAAQSGISRPRAGVFRDSPLGTRYNSLDSERYVLTLDDRAWRDAAAVVPYDFTVILVNERKYGGGGIFGLYATAAAGSAFADYLAVHELGHHFAGLGDEYYTSPVAYEDFGGDLEEPWEPNVTALRDPQAVKWRHLVTEDTPLPTPWNQEAYDRVALDFQKRRQDLRAAGAAEEEMEALFREQQRVLTEMLEAEEHAHAVGTFEGAMYQARGLYRPQADCLMFTRNEVGFCAVCSAAVERVIDLYSR